MMVISSVMIGFVPGALSLEHKRLVHSRSAHPHLSPSTSAHCPAARPKAPEFDLKYGLSE